MLRAISFDVSILDLFNTCYVIFINPCRDINDGRKSQVLRIYTITTLNGKHSQVTLCKARAWLEEVATKVCLVDLQDIVVSPTVNT